MFFQKVTHSIITSYKLSGLLVRACRILTSPNGCKRDKIVLSQQQHFIAAIATAVFLLPPPNVVNVRNSVCHNSNINCIISVTSTDDIDDSDDISDKVISRK